MRPLWTRVHIRVCHHIFLRKAHSQFLINPVEAQSLRGFLRFEMLSSF